MNIRQQITEKINHLSKKKGYRFLSDFSHDELERLQVLIEGIFLDNPYLVSQSVDKKKSMLRRCVKRTIDTFCDEGRRSILLLDDIKINV